MKTRFTALYLRVSTDEQRLDSQRCELQRHCELRGWTNIRWYEDRISGAACSRPALDRMIKDVRSGSVDRVVCTKLDRLGRSLSHLCVIFHELSRLNVPMVAVTQGIDTSNDNPVGRLQLNVLMSVAEFERDLVRERTRAGLTAARARGRRLGRPSSLAVHESRIAELRTQGLGIRAIARELKLPPSSIHSVLAKARGADPTNSDSCST